ncbi:hypothetical protein [Dipodfec virus RodF1_17]|uniref:Uncharacterized protein n=1 Tax=Dipodfec virus RodF1_17 TaxID=2929293 RepID=A0A976N2T7_9VIRU|nr:hypothetical protein [Dipodfec virus RodF1_17]
MKKKSFGYYVMCVVLGIMALIVFKFLFSLFVFLLLR